MDVHKVRQDFPILRESGPDLIYLDNGATSQKPQCVMERMNRYYAEENANIHRGVYPLSAKATAAYGQARRTVARWLEAEQETEIIFTKGCTESINLLAASVFATWIRPGDNIIVTELEHSSNFFSWKYQCEEKGAEFRIAKAEPDGTLNPEALISLIDDRTRFAAITAMSNVTGYEPDVEAVIAVAHEKGVPVLVDAAQGIVHQKLSVKQLDCDFLCFSGHKFYGPMGTGVLYGKQRYLEQLKPPFYGGGMIGTGDQGRIVCAKLPEKFEAGTQNIAGALGLEAAICYVEEHDFQALLTYERRLAARLTARLNRLEGIHVLSPGADSPVIALESDFMGAYDLGVLLAGAGIAVRCGAHCAYPLMNRMKKVGVARISLAFYNTAEEMDAVADRLESLSRRKHPGAG